MLRLILVGLRLHVRPVVGDIELTRLTVPVKPFCPVTVIVDMPAVPAFTVMLVGLAPIMKSVTFSMKVPVDPVWTESPLYAAVIVCVPALPAPGV